MDEAYYIVQCSVNCLRFQIYPTIRTVSLISSAVITDKLSSVADQRISIINTCLGPLVSRDLFCRTLCERSLK